MIIICPQGQRIRMPSLKTSTEKVISFSETLRVFLDRLPARSSDIMEARFGIRGNQPKTLEEIGHTYHITRERVRQVIGSALGFLAGEREHPLIVQVTGAIQAALEERSGIIAADELLKRLANEKKNEYGSLLAFFESLSVIEEHKATREYERIYTLQSFSFDEWRKVKDTAKDILVKSGEALDAKDFYTRFSMKNQKVSEKEFFDFLVTAKEVRQNVFGKWGLASWSDIKPRGTREKAHLVLKTAKKPLHFREIAEMIDNYGLQGKKTKSHPQTVHNELIKDKRFVLVGRGIYALSEWGYKKGTVKEVIEEVLGAVSKPLSREEILAAVLKIRQVKKSTVIINLNTFFARIGKNAYTIKR